MEKENEKKEVKLVRLHDIILYHLQKANPNCTVGDLSDMNKDIEVWVKNFLMTLEVLDAKVDISYIGDNRKDREALSC